MNWKRYPLWLIPALLSLLFNSAIVFSVVLNLDWVRTRAAGGQFTDFPLWLRTIYLGMTFLMAFILKKLWDYSSAKLIQRQISTARAIGLLFAISTVFQLISRSLDERWNAIPAAIIAYSFLRIARQSS